MARCRYNLHIARLQFIVGDPTTVVVTGLPDGSYTLPNVGGSQVLFDLMVIDDSIEVYNEGSAMPRNILDQMSYDVTYNAAATLVAFYTGPDAPGLQADQMIIIHLQYKTPVV